MAVKTITLRLMIAFAIAFSCCVFALGYLVGSRPDYYGTNLAVRIQHLSHTIRRCHDDLARTQKNTNISQVLLDKSSRLNEELSECLREHSDVEQKREECKVRYDQDISRATHERFVQTNSSMYNAILQVRSQLGQGNIGDLLRRIEETDQVQKSVVIRVLLKDIVEKRAIVQRIKKNCNESLKKYEDSLKPPPTDKDDPTSNRAADHGATDVTADAAPPPKAKKSTTEKVEKAQGGERAERTERPKKPKAAATDDDDAEDLKAKAAAKKAAAKKKAAKNAVEEDEMAMKEDHKDVKEGDAKEEVKEADAKEEKPEKDGKDDAKDDVKEEKPEKEAKE